MKGRERSRLCGAWLACAAQLLSACSSGGVIDCGEGSYLAIDGEHYCEHRGVGPDDVTCPAALPEVVVLDGSVRCAAGGDSGSAGEDSGRDVGPMDAGPADGGPADGGPADGGPADGGPADGGPTDASQPDAGPDLPLDCVMTALGTPLTLSTSGSDGAAGRSSIVWTGAQWMIAWATADVRELQVSRVSSSGGLLGSTYLGVTGGSISPGAAWTGTELGVVWISSSTTIEFAAVGSDGITRLLTQIVPTTMTQDGTIVAWTGSAYGFLWNERRGTDHLTARGFDTTGVERWTASLASEYETYILGFVWTGTHFVAVTAPEVGDLEPKIWAVDDTGTISVRGVSLGMDVLDGYDGDAAWGGDEGAAVFTTWTAVVMRQFDSVGTPLDTGYRTVSGAGTNVRYPTVSSDGRRWAVAWEATGGVDDLPLQFVVVDRAGLRVRLQIGLGEAFSAPKYPKIAPTGYGRYGVTWSAMGSSARQHYFQIVECVAP